MLARALDWPFVPEVHLFHSPKKAARYIKKHGGGDVEFGEPPIAQTYYNENSVVICMQCDLAWHKDAALLTHEAYHAIKAHYDYLGEEAPSEEFMAYGIQVISEALFEAHEKWKRKKGRKKKKWFAR